MKRYLKRLFAISSLFVLLLLVMGGARYYAFHQRSWKLSSDIHILFLGASHIKHGIDDTHMKSAINWARGSERYMFTYIKLQHLLAENAQIDTVFLQLAPTDLWEDTDYKYHVINEQSGFVKSYWPYYNLEEWSIYKQDASQVLGLITNSLFEIKVLSQANWWKLLGGFDPSDKTMKMEDVTPSRISDEAKSGHEVNYLYLRKIITLCNQHHIKLYFLEVPTYHPEYFYDTVYFQEAYKKYFSDVEFLDYSQWNIGVDCFLDAHHLNKKGAQKMTEKLVKRFGIK